MQADITVEMYSLRLTCSETLTDLFLDNGVLESELPAQSALTRQLQ